VENSPPPPNFYKCIKEKAKAVGYYIDNQIVHKITQAIPYPIWFTSRYSIIDFVAGKRSGGKISPLKLKKS
jgi:hypothetical protein